MFIWALSGMRLIMKNCKEIGRYSSCFMLKNKLSNDAFRHLKPESFQVERNVLIKITCLKLFLH